MKYNPNIHHRRSIRLKGYDYSQEGLYFITICIQDRKCLFGKIVGAGLAPAPNVGFTTVQNTGLNPTEMELNDFGIVAWEQWQKLPERFTNMELDVFQIMPNHMHGIIMLNAGATVGVASNNSVNQNEPVVNDGSVADHNSVTDDTGAGASPAPTKPSTVGDIVGAYKSLVANDCLEIFKQKYPGKLMGKLWQRNYYEIIIRDEPSYQRISNYIINNPANWNGDKFYNE
jgi:putative transposase